MIYIGIDPDTDKNGVAIWDSTTKKLELQNMKFWDLIEDIKIIYFNDPSVKIVIEGGWLNKKSNWHAAKSKGISDMISKKVGRNHQVGMLIGELCERNGIDYEIMKPLKLVKGKKMDAKTFKLITKYEGRTNPETRDAALLVFGRK